MSSAEDGETGEESGQPPPSTMETAADPGKPGETASQGAQTVPKGATGAPSGTAQQGSKTSGERTAELDDKLAQSLAEFDDELLREQQVLEKEREEEARSTAARVEEAGGEGGGYAGGGEYADGALGETETSDAGGPAQPQVADDEGDDGGGSVGGGAGGRVPSDVGDGSDDDIIARQLREAALAEDDPELREKLWEEYRRYKSGGKKKR